MGNLRRELADIVGETHVLTGPDATRYSADWKDLYHWEPLAVVRPASTQDVSAIVRLAHSHDIAIVPCGGNTGLNAGTFAQGALMVSLERMNKVREIRPDARVIIADAGVILDNMHAAADEHDLIFPLTFGARGSAQVGGVLSTNAGGSNVLRYGNTRALTLGIEVVLPNGDVLDLMSALHKDNTGYDLRDLFVGAEGTLGIITAAVFKLFPKPKAYATAMVSVTSPGAGLQLLNDLQSATAGMVEAYEYMPRSYMAGLNAKRPDLAPPLGVERAHTIMVELGATSESLSKPNADGSLPLNDLLENTLADAIENGLADDAILAKNDTERKHIWAIREAAGEIIFAHENALDTDVSLPLDKVPTFLEEIEIAREACDPGSTPHVVSHLGDGNVHYTIFLTRPDEALKEAMREVVEDTALALGGSFSAEHGIGLSKRGGMARRKDPVALAVMKQIKATLDPKSIMNPGKVLPDG